MKKFKKISLILLIIALAMLVCSCRPATKSEIMKYAKKEYGKAEIIDIDEVSEDEIIYHFKDKEYGFEYYIKSAVNDILIDGAKFGEHEDKESNFNVEYYSYIAEKLDDRLAELENKYNIEIIEPKVYSGDEDLLIEINYKIDDTQTAPTISKKVNDLYKEYDSRGYWKVVRTYAYDKNKEKIGCYDLKYDVWMTPEDENDYFYIERAKMLNSKAVYLRKERKPFKDTGLTLDDVTKVIGKATPTENSTVTYYYFEVEGKEFFLADVLVNPHDRWYSNYDEVMGD